MSALDDAFARLRAARDAADRTFAAAVAPRPKLTPADRARALWRSGQHDTADIAKRLRIREADVSRAIHHQPGAAS